MQNLSCTKKYRFTKLLLTALLVVSHIALTVPVTEVFAMESANFKVDQSAVSSAGGNNTGTGAIVPYSNVAENAVGNVDSANYKASLGYINTIASNPPVLKMPIPDANMRLVWDKGLACPTTISLDNYFTSPDNSALTYQVEGSSNISVVIDPVSHVASFSQGSDFFGSEAVRFIAIDANGNRTKSNFVILVVKAPAGNPPIIYSINDITVKESELVDVVPTIFDPDGDVVTLTYSAPLDDSGDWQTTYNDAGTYTVTATASDGVLKASRTFNITVKNVNRPPVIDPISDITVDEGSLIKLNVAAHDPDGDNVTISYASPIDSDGGWQTTYKDAGVYHFVVTASDGDLSTTQNVNITVNAVNAPPLIKLYADKTSPSLNENFTVYVLAQDPDGDRLKLTLKKDGTVIPGCDNVLLGGQTFTTTLSMASAGSHTIDAIVTETDVLGAPNTTTDSLKISVDENSSSDGYFPISGDFNGDGLTDIGYYNRALGIWKVQLSKGDGTFGPIEYWISSGFGNNDSYCYPLTSDFNGDGRTDAGFIRVPTSDGAGTYIKLAPSTGTGFTAQTANWRSTSAGNLQGDWHYATFTGDFNGDGFTDVGQVRVDSNTSLYIGLTGADLAVSNMENWIKDGSHISISDFTPIAADFNGDGLADLCLFSKSAGRWAVTLSKGDRFGDTKDWLTGFGAGNDPVLGDFNCDGFTDIGYAAAENGQWSIKYAVSDGTKFNLNSGQPYIYQTGIPGAVTGTFMTGDFNGDGLFDIAVFNKNTHEWTVKLHHSKYPDLLVGIDNGIGGKTTIVYKDSSAFENTGADGLPTLPFSIRVVSSVIQSDGLGSNYTTQYFYKDGVFDPTQREFRGFGYVKVIDAEGSYKETYFNQDNIYKGRPSKEAVLDKYNKIYSQTSYNWQDSKMFDNAVDYPYLLDKTSTAYDPATGANKSAKTIYTYDNYGNALNVRNEGFLDTTGDEQEAHITYYYDTTNWILSKPVESSIKDTAGRIVAATKYYYYPNGSLQKEEKWLGQAGNTPLWGSSDNPTTQFTYDTTGNVLTVTDARGNVTATVYEATKTFPATVQNVLGHKQSFTYNRATGKILTSTDPNNQVTVSEYDGFGRLYHVIGPGNISEVTYAYNLTVTPVRVISTTKVADGRYAKAFSFVDGLGRQILSRVEAEYQGAAKHIVSGEVKYDSRGQVVKKYLPYYINMPSPDDTYIPPQNVTPYVSYVYDAMGRSVKTVRPDNKASYTIYGINTIEAINENGQHARQTKDAYGRIVEVEEDTGDLTNYVYDTLGNLIDTYDSASMRNNVHMNYDTLGRKISMTDPDMGGFAGKSWQYNYDKVGNLTSQVDAKGQNITFQYDAINRLQSKSTGVTYAYDDPAKSNCIGRLSRVTDPSGSTEFFYDLLGREIKTTKTIFTASYTVERTYDSLDRLVTVKYPDNSIVTYTYNKQGGIVAVADGQATSYVSSVIYNANGQIERIAYGNGTSTDYAYDPYNFRLAQLKTFDPQKALIQNLSYAFDPIGNVTSMQDSVNTNTQSFQYDDLNRLTQATGNSYGQISYSYDSVGNILKKGKLTMEYGQGAGPHAVTLLRRSAADPGEAITYDHNGNMLTKGNNAFMYDVENRLKKVMTEKGGGAFDLSLNLTAGWNFFSLPGFIPNTNNNVKDILSSIEGKYDQVSTYDTANGKWMHYVGNVKFNQFDKFELGKGYLIYVKEPCVLALSGSFPATRQIDQLKTGWNLVSAPTDSEIEPSRAFRGVAYDSIAEYSSTGYVYNPTVLKKGNAYWIHVTTDQAWGVPLSQVETKYAYDGDGGRVLRQEDDELTVYIGSSYESTGPAGQLPAKITKHIFMGSTRICSIELGADIAHVYYCHQDHLGSSNVITDETGSVVNILEYTPFGEVSRNTGNYSTDKRFTGKIWDETSALYYYGARYYDPELGRFITADPTISHPFDPQDFNRYSYCRNNPVIYVDPTGLSWWSKFWDWVGTAIGIVVGAVTAVITGNLWLGFQAYSMTSSIINAAVTGNWGGLAGGIAGGLIGGAFGLGVASGIYDALGKTSFTFGGGFLGGTAEFGMSGFGSGFGYTLGSGEKFGDALQSGLISGGISTAIGGVIQGSYNAGWQNSIHGMNRNAVGSAANVKRQTSLEIVKTPIPAIPKRFVQNESARSHWGLKIQDNYNEFNGTWDFDYMHSIDSGIDVMMGGNAPGIAQSATSKVWATADTVSKSLKYVTDVYANIQMNLGRHVYNLHEYTCQTWVNNRLALKYDNFTK